MLQLLINDLNSSRRNIRLYPELSHPRTFYTVKMARKIWKDARFTLVIGADLVFQLPNWYRADELLQQVDLLIIPRPGYTLMEPALAQLRRRGARVAIADLMGLDTSSTAYREHRDTEALTPPIEAYIHREHLYTCQDAPREKQPIR
jgi:nicotinate-nucleotide adenylyltransferase